MSFMNTAIAAVKTAATVLRQEANAIGILRSVDATQTSRWLREVDASCEAASSDSRERAQVAMDREVTNHFEAHAWNEWALGMLTKYKLCEGHPPEALNFDVLTTAIDTALRKKLSSKKHREPILSNDGDALMRDVYISVIGESIRQLGTKYIQAFEYLKQKATLANEWRLWAIGIMDEHNLCEKSALEDEPFDVDEVQEALATCFGNQADEIIRLNGLLKNVADFATQGPTFTDEHE